MKKDDSLLQRWARLGRPRQLLLVEAAATLAIATAAVRWLPFKQAVRIGSRRHGPSKHALVISDVSWAVKTAARKLPWKAVCIQQGIALQRMLRRRGVDARLHYGIARDQAGDIEAHVWVAADGRVLIGGDQAERFTQVAIFP